MKPATIIELENQMTPLCHLCRKHGSDKGGAHQHWGNCHNYTPFYHEMLKDRRDHVAAVLEIGIAHGQSLQMWKEYFSSAMIIGLDCNVDCLFKEDRILCFAVDQNNEANLLRVMKQLKLQFDLIVDDGSHEPAHQIFTAQVLLPYLAPNGIYVIEDIEPDCQPQLIGNPIVQNMPTKDWVWNPMPTGRGLGQAYCRCGCEGGEQLVVIRHV